MSIESFNLAMSKVQEGPVKDQLDGMNKSSVKFCRTLSRCSLGRITAAFGVVVVLLFLVIGVSIVSVLAR